MRQPTLRQIQAFKAFVETGTVSRAAEVLYISQPAASKLLTHLEEDTGLRLLDRGHGRMNVTERGMRLYEEIERIFSGVDQIAQAIETIRKEDRGRLTVGIMPGISGHLLANSTKIFRQKHPEVHLSFIIRSSQYLTEGLMARQFDAGIVTKPLNHPQFETYLIDGRRLIAVIPENHALADNSVIGISDLHETPMIGFGQDSSTRQIIETKMRADGFHANVMIEATTAHAVSELVAAGLGIAIMAPIFFDARISGIVTRPISAEMKLPIHVIRPKGARRSALIDTFLECFNASVRNLTCFDEVARSFTIPADRIAAVPNTHP